MTRTKAEALWLVLEGAFPFPSPPRTTKLLYVEMLTSLPDVPAARQAVDLLIHSAERMPTMAAVRAEYNRIARRASEARASQVGLAEAPGVPPPPEWLDLGRRLGVADTGDA